MARGGEVFMELIHRETFHCSRFHVWEPFKFVYYTTSATSATYNAKEKADDLGIYSKKLKQRDWLTSSELVKILKPLNDPLLVLNIFNRAAQRPDYKPSEAIYSMIIDKLACVGRFDIVEELLGQMKKEHCKCTNAFFLNLIKIFVRRAGNNDKALRILFAMCDFKCWPTVETFNYVLNVLVCSKEFDKAYRLYLRSPDMAVSPDTQSVNILLKALCSLGKMDAAYELLSEMPKQECYPNNITYGILMNHLCMEGKMEEAFYLFDKMTEYGCTPDAVIFNILISGLSKQGKIKEAIEIFDLIQSKGHAPTEGSYHPILHGFLRSRNFLKAKAVLDQMLSHNFCIGLSSYKAFIAGLCDEGLVDDAIKVLEQMVVENLVPRMGTWNILVKTVLKNSDSKCQQLLANLLLASTDNE